MEILDYIYFILIGLVAFYLGYKVSLKVSAQVIKELKRELESSNATDRSAYLGVLRRELTNELMNRDPTRYLSNYYHLLDESEKFDHLTRDEALTRIQAISQDYKYFNDFDVIAVRDYILYSDALSIESDDNLIRIYNQIVSYSLLQAKVDKEWEYKVAKVKKEELEHLKEYVTRVEDTKFLAKLHQAERDYFNYSAAEPDEGTYENKEYIIQPIPHFAEVSYGVYIKESGEYGIFSRFYSDDNKRSDSYYRSDELFEERIYLRNLNIPISCSIKKF